MARWAEAEPGISWAGVLSLEASCLSDWNFPCVLLPAHSPARVPPCPPLVQEWRPAPICHPLCEGVPPGLGLGAVQALPVRERGGCGCSQPLALSRGSTLPSALTRRLCCCLPGSQELVLALGLSSLPLGTTVQPSPPSGRPLVEGFYKNHKTKSRGLFTYTPENSHKVCAHVCIPEHWNPSRSLPSSSRSHCTEGAVCPPAQEGPPRNKPLHGGGYRETPPSSPRGGPAE